MRSVVFGGAAAVALAIGPVQAQAQVQSGPGFFGFAGGGYLFDEGPGPHFGVFTGEKAKPGDGFSADAKFGFAFGSGWDVAIGSTYSRTYGGDPAGNAPLAGPFRQTKAEIGNVAAEIG